MSVLFLHGFLGAPSTFDDVRARLSCESAAVWLPWHGRPARACAASNFEEAADSLAPATPSVLAGYSMGARLSLAIALRHPERVSALVLIGVCAGLSPAERAARRFEDDARAAELGRDLPSFVDGWERQPLFASQAALPRDRRDAERARRSSHEPQEVARALRLLGTGTQPDLRESLATLRVPVTLLAGSLDTKFVSLHSAIASRVPGSRNVVVDGAGHNLALEAPETVAREINAVLETRAVTEAP